MRKKILDLLGQHHMLTFDSLLALTREGKCDETVTDALASLERSSLVRSLRYNTYINDDKSDNGWLYMLYDTRLMV